MCGAHTHPKACGAVDSPGGFWKSAFSAARRSSSARCSTAFRSFAVRLSREGAVVVEAFSTVYSKMPPGARRTRKVSGLRGWGSGSCGLGCNGTGTTSSQGVVQESGPE